MKKCKNCNIELIDYVDDDLSCSCHIIAPCNKCCIDKLVCPECGELYDIEYSYKPVGKSIIENKINNYEDFLKSNKDFYSTTQRSYGWVILKGWYRCSYKELIEHIRKQAARPNGFMKEDMFKLKTTNNSSKINSFKASWCVD